jgi:uncharacterized protein
VIAVFVALLCAVLGAVARYQGAPLWMIALALCAWIFLVQLAFVRSARTIHWQQRALHAMEIARFLALGAACTVAPLYWLYRGGAMPAALLSAAAIAAWILIDRRRFAFVDWIYQHADKSRRSGDTADKSRRSGGTADKSRRSGGTADKSGTTNNSVPFTRLRKNLLTEFWRAPSGAEKAAAHFFRLGVWVNAMDALIVCAPLALLAALWVNPAWPHWDRIWLSTGLLLGPALVALRWSIASADTDPATPAPHAVRRRVDPELFVLTSMDSDDESNLSPIAAEASNPQDQSTVERRQPHELLQAAVLRHDIQAVKALLDQGADPNKTVPADSLDQRLPLTIAAANGQLAIAKLLVAAGAEINRLHLGQSALLAATRDSWSGRFDMVMMLLTNGADVHARDSEGGSVLHGAARSTDLAIMQNLIQAGSVIDCLDVHGYTPLQYAVRAGLLANAQNFVKAGANADLEASIGIVHALAQCHDASPALRQWVLSKGNLERLDRSGLSPLQVAAREGSSELVEALLAAGANPNTQAATHGQSALMLAALQGHVAVIQAMGFYKIAIDQSDQDGNSALHYALRSETAALPCVDSLLKLGANAQRANRAGKTPEALALTMGRWDLARRLSPNQALSEDLERTLVDADESGDLDSSGAPNREALLIQCAQSARLSGAKSLLALGPVDRHTLMQALLALGDRLNEEWLSALRLAGLHVGAMETDPLTCALARQIPVPERALLCLLNAGASVQSDAEGDSALSLVCGSATELAGESEHAAIGAELLQALIARGADAGKIDSQLRSAVSYAIDWCDIACLQILLDSEQSLRALNQRDQAGLTPLLRAVKRHDDQRLERVRILIRAGADVNICGRDGQTARAIAMAQNDVVLAELLSWNQGAHPGRALHNRDVAEAAARGDWQGVQRLLQLGFAIDGTDELGITALTHACARGDSALIENLIAHGASIAGVLSENDSSLSAFTPLAACVRARHFDWIRRLVTLGAPLDQRVNGLSYVALAAAALDQDCVTLLLELGAPLHIVGTLPAIHAITRAVLAGGDIQSGCLLLQTLVQRGADPDVPDQTGASALMLLVGANLNSPQFPEDTVLLSMLDALLRLGANALQRDQHQRVALHWCCKHGFFHAAERLLEAGADHLAVDEFRKLPVDMANALNRHDFNALFRG